MLRVCSRGSRRNIRPIVRGRVQYWPEPLLGSALDANPRICGVIAWCAFDYASLVNSYNTVKTPGVADVFRIPKLGASFYLLLFGLA